MFIAVQIQRFAYNVSLTRENFSFQFGGFGQHFYKSYHVCTERRFVSHSLTSTKLSCTHFFSDDYSQ